MSKTDWEISETLRYGYAIFPFQNANLVAAAFSDATKFFSREMTYKEFYKQGQTNEHGYRSLPHKECFIIRNQNVPSELNNCPILIKKLFELATYILDGIAKQLQIPKQIMAQLYQHDSLPVNNYSSSMLRMFRYKSKAEAKLDLGCDPHQDLGLISLMPRSSISGLQIFDYLTGTGWINIEEQMQEDDLLVLVSETLSLISNSYYLPATHQVIHTEQPRYSLVYHFRVADDVVLDSSKMVSPVIKEFSKKFYMTGKEYLEKQMSIRTSVNNNY